MTDHTKSNPNLKGQSGTQNSTSNSCSSFRNIEVLQSGRNVEMHCAASKSAVQLDTAILRRTLIRLHFVVLLYPPPPCISYALVQATVGVGTVIILYVIYLCTKCSVAT